MLWALDVCAAVEICAVLDAETLEAGILESSGLGVDGLGADDEKYDPVEPLGVVEAALEGRGVDGGDERTTWDSEPGTLIDKGIELADAPSVVDWLADGLSVREGMTAVVRTG